MKTLLLFLLASAVSYGQVSIGNSHQFQATCNYTDGSALPCNTTDAYGNVAVWNSATPGILTISSTGKATGISQGVSNVTAVAGGLTSNTVAQQVVTLTSLKLPSVTSLTVGQSLQVLATCGYSDGSSLPCNTPDSYGDSVKYWMLKGSSTNVANIGPTGIVTGVTAGSAAVWAETNSLYGESFIVVQ